MASYSWGKSLVVRTLLCKRIGRAPREAEVMRGLKEKLIEATSPADILSDVVAAYERGDEVGVFFSHRVAEFHRTPGNSRVGSPMHRIRPSLFEGCCEII